MIFLNLLGEEQAIKDVAKWLFYVLECVFQWRPVESMLSVQKRTDFGRVADAYNDTM